jgi:hypothetical protein
VIWARSLTKRYGAHRGIDGLSLSVDAGEVLRSPRPERGRKDDDDRHEPELLVLDEPTSGLDPLVQQTFYELLRQVRAEGRTVLISSHVLPEVQSVVDYSSGIGYLGIELFSLMLPGLLIAAAVGAGARAIAGEEEHATLDLLLANPISRTRVALEKAGAMFIMLSLLSFVTFAASAAVFTRRDLN